MSTIDSIRTRAVRQFLGTMLIALGTSTLFVSCVETAECDEDVRCPDGEVCYELVCRLRCDAMNVCPDGQVCLPCEEDDGAAVVDHCFGRGGSACLANP